VSIYYKARMNDDTNMFLAKVNINIFIIQCTWVVRHVNSLYNIALYSFLYSKEAYTWHS